MGSSDPSLSFTMKLRTCDNNLKAFEIVKFSTDWWIRYNQTEGQSDVKFVYQQSFYQIVNHVPSLIHIPLWNQFSFSIGGGWCSMGNYCLCIKAIKSQFAIFSHTFTRSDNSVNESQMIGGKSRWCRLCMILMKYDPLWCRLLIYFSMQTEMLLMTACHV